LIDMINHGVELQDCNATVEVSSQRVTVRTIRALNMGDEIFISYAPKLSNHQLLYRYGFLLPSNPYKRISISAKHLALLCLQLHIQTDHDELPDQCIHSNVILETHRETQLETDIESNLELKADPCVSISVEQSKESVSESDLEISMGDKMDALAEVVEDMIENREQHFYLDSKDYNIPSTLYSFVRGLLARMDALNSTNRTHQIAQCQIDDIVYLALAEKLAALSNSPLETSDFSQSVIDSVSVDRHRYRAALIQEQKSAITTAMQAFQSRYVSVDELDHKNDNI